MDSVIWYIRPDGAICVEIRPNQFLNLDVAERDGLISAAQAARVREHAEAAE